MRGILNASHHGAGDFSVIVPAELLAEQQRTRTPVQHGDGGHCLDFSAGGRHRNHEHHAGQHSGAHARDRRAARGGRAASDIVRQFVLEAVMISFVGGTLGIVFGFGMSRLIAWLAGWSTIVTFTSIALAFLVSVTVGLIFGTYPAVKAARLDPVEAIRYE